MVIVLLAVVTVKGSAAVNIAMATYKSKRKKDYPGIR